MRDKIITILLVVLMIVGLCSLGYPVVSNLQRERGQVQILTEYDEEMERRSEEQIEAARMSAQDYNKELLGTVIITDPFSPEDIKDTHENYIGILDLNGDGIIGYVEIPRIGIYEPIYHGTSEETLEKGIGHLEDTSFPIGGISTHAVLSGHTGLTEAKIFTDLNTLEENDIFFIHILKETLAYQVDQIKVVEPSDTRDLRIDPEEDYVTLVTCTPYGINSHRLLVRGSRVPYTSDIEIQAQTQKDEGAGYENWMEIYGKAVIRGLLLAMVILAFPMLRFIKKRNRQ